MTPPKLPFSRGLRTYITPDHQEPIRTLVRDRSARRTPRKNARDKISLFHDLDSVHPDAAAGKHLPQSLRQMRIVRETIVGAVQGQAETVRISGVGNDRGQRISVDARLGGDDDVLAPGRDGHIVSYVRIPPNDWEGQVRAATETSRRQANPGA